MLPPFFAFSLAGQRAGGTRTPISVERHRIFELKITIIARKRVKRNVLTKNEDHSKLSSERIGFLARSED